MRLAWAGVASLRLAWVGAAGHAPRCRLPHAWVLLDPHSWWSGWLVGNRICQKKGLVRGEKKEEKRKRKERERKVG